jgi:hypothetical protein
MKKPRPPESPRFCVEFVPASPEQAGRLKHHFPFVDEARCDGYELFYYVWRLSFQFGVTFSDYTLRFEDLIARPGDEIEKLMHAVGIEAYNPERLAGLLVPPARNRWRALASDQWFAEREKRCEAVLNDFLGGRARRTIHAPEDRWVPDPVSLEDAHAVRG